jgi:hypothetical protein
MYRPLARRASIAVVILAATLWLAAGPAAATPAVFGPAAPEASLLETLWSWLAGLWPAGPEVSFEKTPAGPGGDSGTTDVNPYDLGDKGVLIDPNGRR